MVRDLAIFAERFAVPASAAHVLPALFENAAQKAGMAPRALVAEATYRNRALGEYLAKAAVQVAEAA